jgi:hypothetical protein
MFKNKGRKIVENKLVAEVKIVIALVNMVDVHVATTYNNATKG